MESLYRASDATFAQSQRQKVLQKSYLAVTKDALVRLHRSMQTNFKTLVRAIKWVEEVRKSRRLVILPLFHIVHKAASACLAIPFTIEEDGDGFCYFRPVTRLRRIVVSVLHYAVIIRTLWLILLTAHPNITLLYKGMLTVDFGIILVSISWAIAAALCCFRVEYEQAMCKLLYNASTDVKRKASGMFLAGKNILMTPTKDLVSIGMSLGLSGGAVCTPVACSLLAYIFRNSPVLLPYHMVGPYWTIQTENTMSRLGFWGALGLDVLIMSVGMHTIMFWLTVITESVTTAALMLSKAREVKFSTVGSKRVLRLHTEAEVVLRVADSYAGAWASLPMCMGFLVSVLTVACAIKMESRFGVPVAILKPFFLLITAGATFVIYGILRKGEVLSLESVMFIEELEQELRTRGAISGIGIVVGRVRGQRHFRRPLGQRPGSLRLFGSGLSVTYLEQIVENAITLIFLVDMSYPSWLMRTTFRLDI